MTGKTLMVVGTMSSAGTESTSWVLGGMVRSNSRVIKVGLRQEKGRERGSYGIVIVRWQGVNSVTKNSDVRMVKCLEAGE